MTTGERIRQRRKDLGYSADYLAEKLKVSRSTIFRYENGDIEKLPVNFLGPIADALQTTPAYLMGWDISSRIEDTELNILALEALLAKESDLKEKADLEHAIDTLHESLEDLCLAQRLGLSSKSALDAEKKDTIDVEETDLAKALKDIKSNPNSLYSFHNSIERDVEIVAFPIIGSIAAGYNGLALEEYTGDYEYIPLTELHAPKEEYFVLRVTGNSMHPKILDGDKVLVRRTSSADSGKIVVILYDGEEATVKKVHYVYGEDWLELIPANPEYETKRIEGIDLEQCHVLGEVVKLMRDL